MQSGVNKLMAYKVEGDELCSARSMQLQSCYLSHCAETAEVNNFVWYFCFERLKIASQYCLTKWTCPTTPQGWWLPSRNTDLTTSDTSPIPLIWHPQTATSSPRWRRSSVVAILTMGMKLLLLWSTLWRSNISASAKKGSTWASTVGVYVNVGGEYVKKI